MRTTIAMTLLCLVGGCGEIPDHYWPHFPGGHGGSHGEEPEEDLRCLYDVLWAVDGDTLIQGSVGVQTVPTGPDSATQTGSGIAESEPTARTSLAMRNNQGVATLSFGGQEVDSFAFDESFFYSGQREVLSYLQADGTGVEYHVFTSATCELEFPRSATRAEIEALER